MRAKRAAQAEFVAGLVSRRLADDPEERILVVGDMNAFEFNDGYVDVVGTLRGSPAPRQQVVLETRDLFDPDLTNLVDLLPSGERYSYVFDGTAQTLDHMLVEREPAAVGVDVRLRARQRRRSRSLAIRRAAPGTHLRPRRGAGVFSLPLDVETDDASFGHFLDGEGHAFSAEAAGLDAAKRHDVEPIVGRIVHDDGTG